MEYIIIHDRDLAKAMESIMLSANAGFRVISMYQGGNEHIVIMERAKDLVASSN